MFALSLGTQWEALSPNYFMVPLRHFQSGWTWFVVSAERVCVFCLQLKITMHILEGMGINVWILNTNNITSGNVTNSRMDLCPPFLKYNFTCKWPSLDPLQTPWLSYQEQGGCCMAPPQWAAFEWWPVKTRKYADISGGQYRSGPAFTTRRLPTTRWWLLWSKTSGMTPELSPQVDNLGKTRGPCLLLTETKAHFKCENCD